MTTTPSRLLAATVPFLLVALLLQAVPSSAQDATPPAAGDPCLAAVGAESPWPMDPSMMLTPGAMGPGMMTPGPMGPGMMGDVELMVATMFLAHDRVDATLAQAALTRLDDPELQQLADEVVQARTSESDRLQAWRENSYPGAETMPLDQMMTMMAGMMGPMGPVMQGTPWPGMGQMPGMMIGNPIAALCAASGSVDRHFVQTLSARDQIVLAMAGMMQPTLNDPVLQQFVQDVVTSRQQELDQLQGWLQGAPAPAPAGTPAAADGVGATVESYDIYFEPAELTIPAGTEVTVTLPNEGVALHNFSIDELGISVDIVAGETKTVTINAPVGSYEYYCNVPGHKAAGMLGTLSAQEP
ncbi:MAG: halocyanin precursor-like protein [Thermomicrobiales bacterium]|nr:halocyanin precursor-like protein [Thermomicrobiales bacterium]